MVVALLLLSACVEEEIGPPTPPGPQTTNGASVTLVYRLNSCTLNYYNYENPNVAADHDHYRDNFRRQFNVDLC